MARSGRFGRLPRSAPNLASTIVQMVREVNAQEDANMLKAWEEGGLYKGEKVTDDMLLAHFRKRRDSMSPTDPLWDKWNTTTQNYEFAIEESKMSLKYAEKKVDDATMANFYREWAAKLPVDSEAYRNLMRSAAQFADAAAARSGGGGGGGGGSRSSGKADNSAAYEAAYLNTYDRYERGYDTAVAVLLEAAYYEGILQRMDTADPDDLADLRGGDEMDHTQFLRLFDTIQSSDEPFYADMRAYLAEVGLNDLTYGQLVEMGASKQTGIDTRAAVALQFDDKGTAKDVAKEGENFALQRALLGDLDEYSWYQQGRQRIDAAIAEGDLSPYEVRALLNGWADQLEQIRDQSFAQGRLAGTGATDLQGFINRELRSLRGERTEGLGPTAREGNEGGIRNAGTADELQLSSMLRQSERVIDAIESGQAVLWQRTEDGRTVYDAITVNDPLLQDGVVLVNGTRGAGGGVPTFTQFTPLYGGASTAPDPRTGLPTANVAPIGSEVIGQAATINGKTYYGIYQGGGLTWYSQNPFEADARVVANKDGSMTVMRMLPDQALTRDAKGDVQGFDVANLLNPRVLMPEDPDRPYPHRHSSLLTAVYMTDAVARNALLRATDEQLQLTALMSGDSERTYVELRDLRNTVVDRHNAVRAAQRDFGVVGTNLSGRAELMQRIEAGEDIIERTGLTERERERAAWTIESGRAWQAQYEQTGPSMTEGRRAAAQSGASARAAREFAETGMFDPSVLSGEGGLRAYAPSGTTGWAAGKQALPQIKVPEIAGMTGPAAAPGTRANAPRPVAPTPAPVAPAPVAPRAAPPPPPPLLDEDEQRTPTIRTPIVRPVIGDPNRRYSRPVIT